jgi:hypothetical protein
MHLSLPWLDREVRLEYHVKVLADRCLLVHDFIDLHSTLIMFCK